MTAPPPAAGRYVFQVRSYELAPRGQASLASVCHLLQESASLHARELGAAPEQLLAEGLTWFLARMRVRVDRYPVWRDAVTVETWPVEVDPPFAVRDFRVLAEDGEEIGAAASWWLLMDVERRKPLRRIPQKVLDIHPRESDRALGDAQVRLPRLDGADHEEAVRVRGSDLDVNGHVNHVFYVDQVEHAVPGEIVRDRGVSELEIEFRSECHAGDELVTRSRREGDSGDVYLHSLVRERDGREVARARTTWRLDQAESVAGIRRGLASMERGEGRPVTEVFEDIRRRHDIPHVS
jgi:acyl-ACP thioesterase